MEHQMVKEHLLYLMETSMSGNLRMGKWMGRCFTWFPISGLGEPNIYQNLVCFTRMWGFYLECLWLCEELVGVTHRR